ncbi:MAG: hypothetical protein JWL81_1818 [Verrucomicrobiales bacterium]|nr:hypothetical protein [Verrucomicrobiales bacterium]
MKPPCSAARPARRTRAFTLVELLVALSIMATIAGLGSVSHRTLARHTLRQQADTVLGVLTEARATAMRQGTPVRIAFSLPRPDGSAEKSNEATDDRTPPAPAIAGRIFTLPANPSQIPITTNPATVARQLPGAWLPSSLTELSGGLLGRWTALPSLPDWLPLDSKLIIETDLLTQFQEEGPEVFARQNLTLPPHFNGRPGRRLQGRECSWISPYPADYMAFPNPAHTRPVNLPADNQEVLPGTGRRLKDLLGEQPLRHFPAAARAIPQPLALPMLEFLPDGSLSAAWTDEIRLRLTSHDVEAVHYDLLIDTRTGSIRLED